MPQCAFKHCENNHRNSTVSEGVSFFRFPTDPFRCAEWIDIVAKERGVEHYSPCKNSTICSRHFDEIDISGNTQRRRLAKTANPKLQIHVDEKNVQATTLTESTTSKMVAPPTNLKDTAKKTLDVALCSNSPTTSVSNTIPLQDTLRKEYFTKRLARCRKIIETKTNQIRNLRKVNKRLKIKNSKLKNIVNVLKKKKSVDATLAACANLKTMYFKVFKTEPVIPT